MALVGLAKSDAYLSAGAPVVDLVDEVSGAVYVHAPLLSYGSATVESHTHLLAVAAGARLVYDRIAGTNRVVVLGALPKSAVGQKFQAEVEANALADFPADKPTPGDVVIRHGGAVVVLASNGEIVFDAKESGQPVKIQLSGSGVLRVSRDGVEPEEHVLLAGPVRELLDAVVGRLNDVHSELSGLTSDLATSLGPAVGSAVDPAVKAALGLLVPAAQKRNVALSLLPSLLATDSALESSVVLLPADSRDAGVDFT